MADGSIAVIKYGGTAQKSIEYIVKNGETARDLFKDHSRIVTVVSGAGDITDRVEAAVLSVDRYKRGDINEREFYTLTDDSYVFEPWEDLFREAGRPKELADMKASVYKKFGDVTKIILPNVVTPEEIHARRAELNLYPEQLQAALVNYVYAESGLDSICINFDSEKFPLSVEGHFLNGTANLAETREKCERLPGEEGRIIVLPGYGGLDEKLRKTLGRGGSDTAAFAYGYGFKAREIWLMTDVEGIKKAIVNGGATETAHELSADEAADGAFYGAKLPSRDSLEPLIAMFSEKINPEVYIAHHKNAGGEKTKIVGETRDREIAKFIGGRGNVILYRVSGEIVPLLGELDINGVDHFYQGSGRYAWIGINQKGQEIGELMIRELEKDGKVSVVERFEDMALVGVVGEGMRGQQGVGRKLYDRISDEEINFEITIDESPISTGVVIADEDRKRAVEALHDEFFVRDPEKSALGKVVGLDADELGSLIVQQ